MTDARVGLEVHVPLATAAKLYCTCPATPAQQANEHVCPTCTGQPGARPQGVNRRAVQQAITVARLLGCTLEDDTIVQRKHYVYPDLPNNYQRTTTPIGREGTFWEVDVREVHLEEDPGALDPARGTVDLNRSGRPLVEVVTAPDLHDPEEVDAWLDVLALSLDRSGVLRSGAELKADVNVSTAGGDRVEVKNVVGGRNARQAVEHELSRQRSLREDGDPVEMQTRHFDETTGTTRASRDKETVGDYRYMPDPDLHPVALASAAQQARAPEDVPARLRTLVDEKGLTLGEAIALLADERLEHLFDTVRARCEEPLAVEVALRRVRSELDYRDATLSTLDVALDPIIELAEAWHEEQITKHVFTRLLREHLDGADIQDALAEETQVDVELDAAVRAAVDENPSAVEDYREGKDEAVNFLVGQVVAKTQGRADPKATREALVEHLDDA